MAVCNICGGEDFVPGPNGRLTHSGAPPKCADCGSLERHRAFRECLDRLPREMLSWRRALQLAPDPSLDPAWFRNYEGSRYGGDNSLDLQNIARPAASYDFISLSSVLEFVPDDRRAFGELLRIASPDCLIHCTFTPVAAESQHFSNPHGAFGRYHIYGLDLEHRFATRSHDLTTLMVTAIDPTTEAEQPIHLFCRRRHDADLLRASLKSGTPSLVVSAQATATI